MVDEPQWPEDPEPDERDERIAALEKELNGTKVLLAEANRRKPMPAQSLSSERAVLAILLQHRRAIAECRLLLVVEDFYRPAHAALYGKLCQMHEDGVEIDPVRVATEMVAEHHGNSFTSLMAELVTDSSVVSANLGFHAMRVRELARVRAMRMQLERGIQMVENTERGNWRERNTDEIDLDLLQTGLASVSVHLEALVDERMTATEIAGLSTYTEFLAIQDRPQDWLVEELLEKQDVHMMLGGEGGGKSWWSRQWVLCLGAGIHPLDFDHQIEPVNSLLIDLENADSMIRRQSRAIHTQAARSGNFESLNTHTHIWRRQEGLNLRKAADQRMWEAVVERVRPQFIAMGSLYNAFSRGGDDWETAAEDVKEFINKMRARYGFAILLEHHMPKGDGKDRPATPYGSSVWQRWVTHGRVLNRRGENVWELSLFRGDRDPRRFPAGLERGGQFPWSPIWTDGDLDARIEIEEEVDRMRGRRR